MPQFYRRDQLHPHVVAIMDETGTEDPFEAVRVKARNAVLLYHQFIAESPPFNMRAFASTFGLHWSDDDPRYSADSEIAPESDGRVVLRVNKSRPETRQRFSIGHEIGHTLFPEYELSVQCRKATDRTWADPNDLIETLCDAAASELLFPTPWFSDRILGMPLCAPAIASLADEYAASREATARRFVELHHEPLAAVFFSWKLKPTEIRSVKAKSKTGSLFPGMELPGPAPMLRVDYRIINEQFATRCTDYIPDDKSIPSEGPIYDASMLQLPQEGLQKLDFGRKARSFQISALPIFTAEEDIGPNGGSSVVAILRPAK